MRSIDLENFEPSEEWQERADEATQALRVLGTAEERLEYIRTHSKIWRDLRDEFIAEFGSKCWFTDAPEFVAVLDVEHFRPKAKAVDLTGVERAGYWWLAFDHENLRLCGQIINREFKRCYFPLQTHSPIASADAISWRNEYPLFLDPANPEDVALVRYGEDGCVHARGGTTKAEKFRVEKTDELFGLSSLPLLVEERKKIWKKCQRLVSGVEKLKAEERTLIAPNPVVREKRLEKIKSLKRMCQAHRPFASVVCSFLNVSDKPWVKSLLASPA